MYLTAVLVIHYIENLSDQVASKHEKRKAMTEKGQIYKCDVCGNVVSEVEASDGDLVCCGQNMRLLGGEEAKKY
jgi:desulfoferrodoxin-like iron-binding protein